MTPDSFRLIPLEKETFTPLLVGRFFARAEVAYLHLHNARPGCFACRVEQA